MPGMTRLKRQGLLSIQSGVGTIIFLVPVIIVFLALIPGTADAQDVLQRDPARHTLSTFINQHVEYGCRNTYVPERSGSTNIRGQVNEISVQAPNTLVAHKSGAEDIEIEVEDCAAVVIGGGTFCSDSDSDETLPSGQFSFRIEYEDYGDGRCARIIED